MLSNVFKTTLSESGSWYNLFHHQGFVAVSSALTHDSLQLLREDLQRLLDNSYPQRADMSFDERLIALEATHKEKLHTFQIEASKLSSLIAICSQLKLLLCRLKPGALFYLEGMGYVLGLPNNERLSYGWHQDGSYHVNQLGSRIHVWFPVFRTAHFHNGAMSFLKGPSNLCLHDFEFRKAQKDGYTTNQIRDIDCILRYSDEVVCDLDVGDCVFFSDTLVHKSNLNKSNKCRLAAVFKFGTAPNSVDHIEIVGV